MLDAGTSCETAADLRVLYRSAEARAARLRVLVEASRALTSCDADGLDAAVQQVALRAAHLAGYAQGQIVAADAAVHPRESSLVLPLVAPGGSGETIGALMLEQRVGAPSADDREALDIIVQLVGSALAARAREAQLARLLTELLGAQEAERSRVAHELHDGVAQSAAALARRLDLAADGEPEDLAEATRQARALVRELRQVIAGMRPPALDDLGLAPALRQLADDAGDTLGVSLTVDLAARPSAAMETALFRIVQEGLNNARAHAGPGAQVVVRIEQDAGTYRITIADDGVGFDPLAVAAPGGAGGLGLAYMRERIARLGGHLRIAAAPGQGCHLLAEIPAG
jgi:signal transduction histidine kinase